jgi:hypothetical protein
MLFEVWAVRVKQDMLDAGGRLVMFERIPHEVVAGEDLSGTNDYCKDRKE